MIHPRIDELTEHVDTRYALVIIAAKRARQINNYHHQLGEGTFDDFPPPLVESRSKNYLTMGLEGVRGHEPLGIRRQDRSDLVARPYEESAKLARLVGGDPTRDSEKNSSHRGSQRLLSPAARL